VEALAPKTKIKICLGPLKRGEVRGKKKDNPHTGGAVAKEKNRDEPKTQQSRGGRFQKSSGVGEAELFGKGPMGGGVQGPGWQQNKMVKRELKEGVRSPDVEVLNWKRGKLRKLVQQVKRRHNKGKNGC